MTRILYLDCVGGLAGDMLLAALLDAGGREESLAAVPEALAIGPVEIRVTRVERQGVGALHVEVVPPPEPPPRTWRRMRELIEGSSLAVPVRDSALRVLGRLAEAEAEVHGMPVDDVHFHELGAVDTLVDVCGAVVLLAELGVERVVSSPLPLTRGLVQAAHGVLPVPAPATVALIRGAIVRGVDGSDELVTPTGAALASTLASDWGPVPELRLEHVGYGAGTQDTPDRPNVLRVLIGEAVAVGAANEVVLLETNLDDLVPELVPDAAQRCVEAGALDVWTAPVTMKKGRPGIVLSALARPDDEAGVARAMLEETSALGVRVHRLRRYELERRWSAVAVGGGEVRVKVASLDGRVVNVAPEHDDCLEIARRTGRPVKTVWAEAMGAAARLAG